MEVINNVIYHIGNCGLAAWDSSASGLFINNIVTECGEVDEWVCKQTGVWMNSMSFEFAYNDIWGNTGEQVCSGGVPDGADCSPIEFDGIDGNLSVDPEFTDTSEFELSPGSQLIDQGDPDILDTDGSRSDMGVHGGPNAGQAVP